MPIVKANASCAEASQSHQFHCGIDYLTESSVGICTMVVFKLDSVDYHSKQLL